MKLFTFALILIFAGCAFPSGPVDYKYRYTVSTEPPRPISNEYNDIKQYFLWLNKYRKYPILRLEGSQMKIETTE